MSKPTYEQIRELFDYDPERGCLVRKVKRGQCFNVGDVAGSLFPSGYYYIEIDGKSYSTHRLIWLWHNGYWSENQIDHVDQDKLNNRIENLREVSKSCNLRNTGNSRANTSGVKGVQWNKNKGKWDAKITIDGKQRQIGTFSDFVAAVVARWKKEVDLGWDGCCATSPAYLYLKDNGLLQEVV